MEKRCGKCRDVKSVDEFYKDSSKKDGYASHCKLCRKTWDKNNPEYQKQHYEENKERITEYQKNYYEKNKSNS